MMENEFFGKRRLDSIFIEKKMCSQRAAKNFFLNNNIIVNGKRVIDGKILISKNDCVELINSRYPRLNESKKIKIEISDEIYIKINKPKGIVCSKVSDSHETVYEWIQKTIEKIEVEKSNNTNLKKEFKFIKERINELHCVGRLDSDTTGLLILTTDGFFSHTVTNPQSRIKKTYFVKLREPVKSKSTQEVYTKKAAEGLTLPPDKKSPEEKSDSAKIEWKSENECEITVTEGKFHEIRRIFKALGNEVVELRRISIGRMKIGAQPIEIVKSKELKEIFSQT